LYTTEQAILDFEAVRVALGSPLLNLVGGSYGTRAALSWMRMFPDSLRSVVLDSVAPPQITLFLYFGQDAEASWKQLAADCEKQPACHQTFPDPTEELQQLLASLPKASSTPDPTTGELLEGEWTRLKVLSAVRAALYSPELSALLPLAIRQANQGDFAPLSAMLLGFSSSVKIADGLLLSVVCTEDLPRITEAPSSLLFGNDALSFMQQTCTLWPKGLPARDHAAPVVSSIPTLLLSGLGDPVTPPRQAQEAAATLSHSKVLVAPGAAHIVMGRGCSASLLKNFINAASVEGLKESCVEDIERPPFFVDRLGPVND
jgi:pimeloyl-ACP methyl ester carboxylesterase